MAYQLYRHFDEAGSLVATCGSSTAGLRAILYRRYAEELVALAPDILVGSGASAAIALQRTSRTVPIVFAGATDPVGDRLVPLSPTRATCSALHPGERRTPMRATSG